MWRENGLSANRLKTIAMLAMFIDHFARLVAPDRGILYAALHFVGRITAPLLFYFAVEGYHRTRSVKRYALRLALFAAISYVPYIFFMHNELPGRENFLSLNVIYTIFLGLMAVHANHKIKTPAAKALVLTLLFALSSAGDWGYVCLLIMLVFDHYYGDYQNQRFAYILVVLTAGGLIERFLNPFWRFLDNGAWNFTSYWLLISGSGMLVPIYLLKYYNGQKGRGGKAAKWSFYIFYPFHYLILSAIRYFLQS